MVNSIVNDMLVLEKVVTKNNGNYVYSHKCKCVKCGRIHYIRTITLKKGGKSTTHRRCNDSIDRTQEHFKRFYAIYSDMRTRITNKRYKDYDNYGGRGLTTQYEHLIDFYDDMWESYLQHVKQHGESNTTLDRIDNNVGYYFHNLRWTDKKGQSMNRRNVREFYAYSPDGKVYKAKSMPEFGEQHGLDFRNIHACLNNYRGRTKHKGWTFKYCDETQ